MTRDPADSAAAMQHDGAPLFDPRGVFWRVNREGVLLLGGGAALLLQIAHPLVAAGVARHSHFQARPLRRLHRTLGAMHRMIHADRQTALETARHVRRAHDSVHGVLSEPTPAMPAGTPYRASDPPLLLWVHATLVATALRTYETVVEPLTAEEREAYYDESRTLGGLMGLRAHQMPANHASFTAYFHDMLDGPVLAVTPTTRRLAADVLHPPVAGLPRLAGDLLSVATTALLPDRVRSLYGLRWSPARHAAWRAGRTVLRGVLPVLPDVLRTVPGARRAEARGGQWP